jgi:hypothetical protein
MTRPQMIQSLTIEYLDGRPLIAYLNLPHMIGLKSYSMKSYPGGLIVDFDWNGRPLGIEILDPPRTSLAALNRVMKRLRLPRLTRADVAPLRAA